MFYHIEDSNLSKTILKTRRSILEKSFSLFCRDGFYKTTMVDIAKDVKVTRRTLYNHFNTKEEIASLLHSLLMVEVSSHCSLDLDTDEPSWEKLSHYIECLYDSITSDRDTMAFIVLFDQYAGENPQLFESRNMFVPYLLENTILISYLQAIKEKGCFADETLSPELIARVICESLIAFIGRVKFRENSYMEEGFYKEPEFEIITTLLSSLKKEGCQ